MQWVGTALRADLGAKVQIGLRPVQRCKGEDSFGSQVSGSGLRSSGAGSGPRPEPETPLHRVGMSALAQPRLTEDGQPYLAVLGRGATAWRPF